MAKGIECKNCIHDNRTENRANLHWFFVEQETYEKRIEALTSLVATMPEENRKLIVTIMKHLKK